MVSQKRSMLLSEKERERLMDRVNLDKRTNSTNAIRVKRKLAAWLDNISDVGLILHQLPKDQLRSVFKDGHVYSLLAVAIEIMKAKNFRPVVGDVMLPDKWETENPDKWEATVRGVASSTGGICGPATDVDIARSDYLTPPIKELFKTLGLSDNPVVQAVQFRSAQNDTAIQKVIKDNPHIIETYRKALERIAVAEASIKDEERQH